MVKKILRDFQYDNAKMTKRFVSYLIDWYVGALFTSIPLAMVSQKMFGEALGQTVLTLPKEIGIMTAIASLCCALVYYVIIPTYVWVGQTPGKRFCKIKIVQTNLKEVTLSTIIMRSVVGIIFLEGALVSASTTWHQLFFLVTGLDIIRVMMYAGFVVTAISILILVFDKKNRALHDVISNTVVVECN